MWYILWFYTFTTTFKLLGTVNGKGIHDCLTLRAMNKIYTLIVEIQLVSGCDWLMFYWIKKTIVNITYYNSKLHSHYLLQFSTNDDKTIYLGK